MEVGIEVRMAKVTLCCSNHLMDRDAVGVDHLVELVDAADAAVGQHHRAW